MNFLQGDTYNLPVSLSDKDGLLDVSLISEVEFMFGNIRKLYPNDVTYDEVKGVFYIPLSQQETFSMINNEIECQARVKFNGGSVKGTRIIKMRVMDSISKAVL